MNKKTSAIIVCVLIGIVATFLAGLQNFVGGPMIGLLIGMVIVNLMPKIDSEFKDGTSFVGKKFLNFGIILAGGTLDFAQVLGFGAKAMPLILTNLCLAFLVANFVGKKFELSRNTKILVGSGTTICGGTAIATLSGILKAKEEEIAYAMTAIFLFDVIAALSYPYLAGAIGLSQNQFAFLAGTAINDTSSVAAAESTYNALNGVNLNNAITVKLARTTVLIPLALVITALQVRESSHNSENMPIGESFKRSFPLFIVGFLLMALLNTMGVFEILPDKGAIFGPAYKFFVTVALAGVGFKIKFKDLFTKGLKPIITGGLTWLVVATSSMIFIHVFEGFINSL